MVAVVQFTHAAVHGLGAIL